MARVFFQIQTTSVRCVEEVAPTLPHTRVWSKRNNDELLGRVFAPYKVVGARPNKCIINYSAPCSLFPVPSLHVLIALALERLSYEEFAFLFVFFQFVPAVLFSLFRLLSLILFFVSHILGILVYSLTMFVVSAFSSPAGVAVSRGEVVHDT